MKNIKPILAVIAVVIMSAVNGCKETPETGTIVLQNDSSKYLTVSIDGEIINNVLVQPDRVGDEIIPGHHIKPGETKTLRTLFAMKPGEHVVSLSYENGKGEGFTSKKFSASKKVTVTAGESSACIVKDSDFSEK